MKENKSTGVWKYRRSRKTRRMEQLGRGEERESEGVQNAGGEKGRGFISKREEKSSRGARK